MEGWEGMKNGYHGYQEYLMYLPREPVLWLRKTGTRGTTNTNYISLRMDFGCEEVGWGGDENGYQGYHEYQV